MRAKNLSDDSLFSGFTPAGTPVAPFAFAQEFHACLARHGLQDWTIYTDGGLRFLAMAEKYLREMDCADSAWLPMQEGNGNAFGFVNLYRGEDAKLKSYPTGCLLLRRWHVAIARWHTFSDEMSFVKPLQFCAARSLDDLQRFRDELYKFVRKDQKPTWQVFGGEFSQRDIPRDMNLSWDSLVMEPALRDLLQTQAVDFFGETTRKLYRDLGLPHKRGILLWGQPGNGKTSIIRTVASMVPGASAICLQPGEGFNDDVLRMIIEHWREESPSLLVIEDLDGLLKRISVATLLNLLDGVGPQTEGGHLLIATTNHPDLLDPAISNRPGRFDVALEIPLPSRQLREAYFLKNAPELNAESRALLTQKTDGLSFSHLREVLLAAGYKALRCGRTARIVEDFLAGALAVRTFSRIAETGFECTNTERFGFVEKLAG